MVFFKFPTRFQRTGKPEGEEPSREGMMGPPRWCQVLHNGNVPGPQDRKMNTGLSKGSKWASTHMGILVH